MKNIKNNITAFLVIAALITLYCILIFNPIGKPPMNNLVHIKAENCVYSDSSKEYTKELNNRNLYYDYDTRIVYINLPNKLSVYLSENGIPCKYDVLRKCIVEVVDGSEYD